MTAQPSVAAPAGLVARAPAGLNVRGTVLVIPGRGESPAGYRRFAARLAADAYEVRVAARPALDDLDAYATHLVEVLADAPATPVVVVGSDTGALVASALAGRGALDADVLVLAGVPRAAGEHVVTWDDELELRSACPAHRQVLSADPDVDRGALGESVPVDLVLAAGSAVPHLIVSGTDDALAAELDGFVATLPTVEVVTVTGAHHDVLNDLQHRSVAAAVVTFLERVRQPSPAPIVQVGHSAWAAG
ncbi:alpha/beta hydrolase [Pseudonocardia sp. GCM10023141]|uniref:alpha/beta hydrolase n=1 Tax=Pseudonocardia sp. GCM10023141 TaxID=3252653 RepID=UPI00361325A5